ncbi:putative cation/H+ exchanger, rmlC-like jelly roll, cation/H+ exchanger, CPA1 family [Helianthus annuus]|uniref:Cation/H+ exchanger, rmlC-like jelly roll, cation/H+ exchanger, CPA1 family n=2 Tax=Helianthus annuus TaxID=4232 RepID=A0A9K3DXE1_HELAN|nr:sodium/hydrogen exchanger 8-like isoform X1 [Helianthus annuus]KAF5763237.1 putative cation/H+ exchanger, rmlC-like jelly roll, cation/H+ exchanger, CPA1 family [Helianthus annuus]KAJ0450137.1 putative cation/H+ exchanger, rmlC-like jelly roll, cation/H+ exchanger, CPA1 family [Helianthus annuus]KAJ0471921.1 putative cation/H+ exchanger, rmlC-like jelly roll, cation/H+ exchanger, CPA1 family [Helianthus annuus]KAJ0647527.1 putative cation/H+ exchanger, rmlC-like jelly roll, cation/H+ exchang
MATEGESSNPTDAVLFVGISLVLGIASRHVLRGTRVPYTVALLVIGIGLGSLEYGTSHRLGKVGDGIRIWANIDPDLLLAVFLPALLFESSFSMEVHQIKKCMAQMVLLAGPGVLISTFILGAALKLIFPYNWSWKTSLLLGGLLSATDPVAVVALLKELGASKKLSTIIEGESLMNDGTAIVVYTLFFRMVTGSTFSWGTIIKFLSQVSLGAVGMGIAFGLVSYLWLGFIFNDTVIEITLTLAVSYLAYFVSQEGADISGVLTVMTLGMFYAAVARTAFKGEGQQSLHHFWEMVAYIANTLIFILSGVVIAEGILGGDSILKHEENVWGYLILLYVLLQLSRAIVVGSLYPLLSYCGYGLDWKEATVLVWSGLRGAVALSLSLSVKQSSDTSSYISRETGTLFVFFTGGIVFLTLIINGSTTQFVLRMLQMDKLSAAKTRILEYTKYEMMSKALEAFGDLVDDEELGPADWSTVKKYITSLQDSEGERMHPHTSLEDGNNVDHMHLSDIRIRFLNGVQAAYWVMLEQGRITQFTANILMQSVDEALDLVSSQPLCDWNGLKANVRFPNYYKFLQSTTIPRKLVTYFTVERLESACYISAAFLRAHRIARQQLHDFIGDSEIALAIINESETEGEEAKKFLEDVRTTFPQVLRVLKTRQVTYSVLNHLIEYVQDLEKSGLLEEKELVHIHDGVQTDLKKLLRNPPLVKIPKAHDLISANPLLGALPSTVREKIAGSTKETMKLRAVTLYREDSKANGVWLISNGVVKWDSTKIKKRYSLHPTFAHGSTLGLYEVLTGKRYMCDIITDSVVLGFFIEAEKILSVLGTDDAVDDFLWQESSIILSKLLVPQIFEKMTMHDLRTLVAERSTMNTYISGESFDLPQNMIGLLLEGFIKTQGTLELITAPAALFPSYGDRSFRVSEIAAAGSFCHHATSYVVETRSRVMMFEISGFEGTRTLQRRASSLISHGGAGDNPSPAREHSGLMSWPQGPFKSRQHSSAIDNNLSARAMQLSMYGSMISNERHSPHNGGAKRSEKPSHSKSYPRVPPTEKPSHSKSYPRVPPTERRGLLSVRSEGSTTVRKTVNVGSESLVVPDNRNDGHEMDYSSDESGGEDEHIVRIDSPSTLSFRAP